LDRIRAGASPSGAYRMMMTRIAAEKALRFEPLVPDAYTSAWKG
jgi:antitoxin component of RelBE/YafQ-DinJ toxin-antitoxin module